MLCDCDIIWRFQSTNKLSLCIDSAPIPGFRRLSSGECIDIPRSKQKEIPTKSKRNFYAMELEELGNVDVVLKAISQFLAAKKLVHVY